MATTSSLPLARRLLRASLTHIPQHGFTVRAAQAALSSALATSSCSHASSSRIPELGETDLSQQEAEDLLRIPSIGTLFGGPVQAAASSEKHFTKALFEEWDRESLHRAVERFRQQGRDAAAAGKGKGKASEERPAQYADVVHALEERLLISAEVRAHLLDVSRTSAWSWRRTEQLISWTRRTGSLYTVQQLFEPTANALFPLQLPPSAEHTSAIIHPDTRPATEALHEISR
jgi:hypothetical protein